MHKINVIIGLNSNDMLWQALIKFLQAVPDIDLELADNQFRLNKALSSQDSNVLILEKSPESNQSDYLHYLELNPQLGIIIIDPVGTQTLIRLSNTGCHQLVELIRVLGKDDVENASCVDERLCHLNIVDKTKDETTTVVNISERLKSENLPLYLNDICEWLDLTLHLYFQSLNSCANETNVPGWAMSADQAQSLLGTKFISTLPEDLAILRDGIEAKIEDVTNRFNSQGAHSKFIKLTKLFDLKGIEMKITMLALAPEIDDRYARIFGYINDDLSQCRPTASTIRKLLFSDFTFALDVSRTVTDMGAFAKYKLLVPESSKRIPESMKGLRLADEIVEFLLCDESKIPNYPDYLQLNQSNQIINSNIRHITTDIQQRLCLWDKRLEDQQELPVVQLLGNESALHWFTHEALKNGVNVVTFKPIFDGSAQCSLKQQFESAQRVAVLHQAILILSNLDTLKNNIDRSHVSLLVNQLSGNEQRIVFHGNDIRILLCKKEIWQIQHQLPNFYTRVELWLDRAESFGINLTKADATLLASTIRIDESEIDSVLTLCICHLPSDDLLSIIQSAARHIASSTVPSAIRCVESRFKWGDIILPDSVIGMLKQIPGHVKHADKVLDEWGYRERMPFGCGVAALFTGSSGTGKTMAAQIIACELGVKLFQVDLAKTVSKYIGETEKNLDSVFDAALQANAVLLFDEADALFSKRTEVKDAHDRYANVEVAYLLQRLESYSGLTVLTTNFRQNMDKAFLRRLRFVIEFPIPNAKDREKIWQCVFPSNAPLAKGINFTFLARRLNITGGNIQQIAIRAAFAAVEDEEQITMHHIAQATHRELHALGMAESQKWLMELVQPRFQANIQ